MSKFSLKILPYYMHELKKSLNTYLGEHLENIGLSDREAKYLYAIYTLGGKSTLSDLTRFTHFDKAHTSRGYMELKVKGLATNTDDKKRNFGITLTDKGMKLAKELDTKISSWEDAITSRLSKDEMDRFMNDFLTIISTANSINEE